SRLLHRSARTRGVVIRERVDHGWYRHSPELCADCARIDRAVRCAGAEVRPEANWNRAADGAAAHPVPPRRLLAARRTLDQLTPARLRAQQQRFFDGEIDRGRPGL